MILNILKITPKYNKLLTSSLTKVSYASASLSAALLNQYFQASAEYFYITEMKMKPIYYALALGIWAIWNSINDPIAGWYMDRNSTKWGRRLPWMLLFWLPLVISFALIFSPPPGWIGDQTLLFGWLIIILIIFDTSYTVVILAWAALFPELFTNEKERNIVAGLRQVFSLFALVFALVLPPFFVFDGDIGSYRTFGWILAGISFVNLGFAFYGCKEPKYEDDSFQDSYSLKEGYRLVKNNKTFLAFLIGNLITFFAYGQVLAFLPFYRNFILNQPKTFELTAYGAAMGMTLLSILFWVWLTNRADPKTTYLVSASIFAATLIPIWFVTELYQVIILLSMVGFGLGGQLMVVDLLLSDVIDKDFIENDIRREGIFFGLNGFFIRIAILLQAISLAIISTLTGFDETAEVQSSLANTGIKIQFIVLPIIGFITGFYVISKHYDLEGEKLETQRVLMKNKMESNIEKRVD